MTTCPECKSPVTSDDDRCAVCGYDRSLSVEADDDCDSDYNWDEENDE